MTIEETLIQYSEKYNSPKYFETDPIKFPRHFAELYKKGEATIQDVEIAAVIAAHLAWGRRDMIVRDCNRAFDEMQWEPYQYIMAGNYRNDNTSLHRTIKWIDFAQICHNLKAFYTTSKNATIETLTPDEIRTKIYSQKSDLKAANKKIYMLRRWMVRNDGIVDLGLWTNTSPADLIIPLDIHVHTVAKEMGITSRKSTDLSTAQEITSYLKKIFPQDPCKGDFALFGYGVSRKSEEKEEKNC